MQRPLLCCSHIVLVIVLVTVLVTVLFTYYAAHCAAACACSHMCCKCAPHSAALTQARSQEETTELRKQIVQLQIDSEQQEAALKQQHAIELFEAQKALMTSQADGEQKDLELHSSSEQIQKISKLESQIEQQTQLNTKCAAGCCCVALVRLAAAGCFDSSRAASCLCVASCHDCGAAL